jgi:hypothetical protein
VGEKVAKPDEGDVRLAILDDRSGYQSAFAHA